MNNPKCATCGAKMKGNGVTKAGTKRWRCPGCGASSVRKHDKRAKQLEAFLRWLLSKDAIADLKTSRSTFWRKTSWVWSLWPIAPFTAEVFNVVFLEGIWLGRKAVVPIAVADGHVIGWHLAQCASAWAALMVQRFAWLAAWKVQRWMRESGHMMEAALARPEEPSLRAMRGAGMRATLRPKLESGIEPLGIANSLKDAQDADAAASWLVEYSTWCTRWDLCLREFTIKDGKRLYTHERLRKARHGLNKRIKGGTLFTFVEMQQNYGGRWPSTNNAAESVNARLRGMLRLHRGLPLLHRMKAIFWWCYMHTEHPLAPAEIIRIMPTDADVEGLFSAASGNQDKGYGAPKEYGFVIDGNEFHMLAKYRQ